MTQWKEAEALGELSIDPTANIHNTAHLDYTGGLVIGAHVDIGAQTMIYTHAHQLSKAQWRALPSLPSSKHIQHHVFIGPNCFVTAKCHSIGQYSVVGAHSVVTKDIPAFEIWAGNPARKIGDVEL